MESLPDIPAIVPTDRRDFQYAEWWFGRFERLRALAAEEGPSFKVAFVGDSITEHWEAAGKNVVIRRYIVYFLL